MILASIGLFLIAVIILIKDYKTESTKFLYNKYYIISIDGEIFL